MGESGKKTIGLCLKYNRYKTFNNKWNTMSTSYTHNTLLKIALSQMLGALHFRDVNNVLGMCWVDVLLQRNVSG